VTAPAAAPPKTAAPPEGRQRFRGDPTAHLCAAAYLDYKFREEAVTKVYSRPDLAVAPNPGCDAVPVLRHVRRARAIDLVQDLVLVAAFAACVAVPGADRLLLLACLAAWSVPAVRLREAGSSLRVSSNRRRARLNGALDRLAERTTRLHVAAAVLALGVLLWIDVRSGGMPVWAVLLSLALCRSAFEWYRLYCLSRVAHRAPPRRRPNRRIARIGEAQRSAVVVYPRKRRRNYPGFGFSLLPKLFTLALGQTEEQAARGEMRPFTVAELHGFLRKKVAEGTAASPTASALPDLTIAEQCFVSDFHVDRPVADPDEPAGPVRRELLFQVSSPDGSSVTSFFTRFSLEGGSLSMWFSPCVIPDTRTEYHVFRDGPLRWRSAMIWCGIPTAATVPIDLLLSPLDLAVRAARGLRNTLRGHPELTGWRPPDRGARIGVRELGYDPDPSAVDLTEPLIYLQILHRQVLEALKEFLTERNIDAGPLEDQMTAVVNYGVINHGEMNAGAVGPGAQSTTGSIGTASTGTVAQPPAAQGKGKGTA
jgi:hypothetical protein